MNPSLTSVVQDRLRGLCLFKNLKGQIRIPQLSNEWCRITITVYLVSNGKAVWISLKGGRGGGGEQPSEMRPVNVSISIMPTAGI